MRYFIVLLYFYLLFINGAVCLAENNYERKVCYATRIDSLKPIINGRLDDACWQIGSWRDDFVQWDPHEGATPGQRTEFKILYDDDYLYCAYRAFDNEPKRISHYLVRRDNFSGDCGGFAFDSYYDRRTAYEFALNAAGTKLDLSHLDTGSSWEWDLTWDAVWDGKTALEDSAWTMELRIPFNQLRFTRKDDHTMGLHVWRYIQRSSEESHWQPIPRHGQGGVHYFGDLRGINNIKNPRRVEIMPYFRGRGELIRKEAGNPFADGRNGDGTIGIDGKIGLRSNFVLDLTVNPDFGQVEADPSVINLTAFETFFEEKRQFFMEGRQSIMTFQLDDDLLYYSRRIGKSPSYSPGIGAMEHIKMPENNTILNALKLTGKTDNGLSVGLMQSITSNEKARIYSQDGYRKESVEPLTGYFVGRVQKEYRQGGTVLGGIITSTNRKIDDDQLRFLHTNAYSGGLDLLHMWGDMTYYTRMKSVFSSVQGDEKAITNTQLSSRHYYQRSDADYLNFDPSRTSLSGYGGTFEIGKGGSGNWRFSENMTWFSPGLDFNDIGYLKTADIVKQNSKIDYVVNKPFWMWRDFSFSVEQDNHWNFGGDHLMSGGSAELAIQFMNRCGFGSEVTRSTEILDPRILRGGPAFLLPAVTETEYKLYSDHSRRFSLQCSGVNRLIDDPYSRYFSVSPGYVLRLNNSFNISNIFTYEFNRDNLQYVDTFQLGPEKRYLLGRINQKTFLSAFRFNYCLTPDLTIQYYGQPFISAGTYSNFKHASNFRATTYGDRYENYTNAQIGFDSRTNKYVIDDNLDGTPDQILRNPDFNVRQLRSNFVVRWEYSPGSTVYLVWSQNRNSEIADGRFRFRNDLNGLFNVYPHNVFLVKWTHWFSV